VKTKLSSIFGGGHRNTLRRELIMARSARIFITVVSRN